MANKFKVHLHWQDCSDVIRPAPLVVLLPWVWAESKYTAKYAELAARNGWDVLTARWPMQAMWFPLWAHRLAMSLVEAIGSSLLSQGERPVVFWAFSGSAKVSRLWAGSCAEVHLYHIDSSLAECTTIKLYLHCRVRPTTASSV